MWENFKHKAVRDLAWSLYSARLIDEDISLDDSMLKEEYSLFEEQLNLLDNDPSDLNDFLATKNTRRLGHYFEQLIFYWLQYSTRFDIMATNMSVRTNKGHTLGEIDLIVFDKKQNLYEHWEFAVKFYLAYPQEKETLYIGPNANDYLHLKLQKLIEQQCKILECTEGQKILSDLEIPYIQSKLLIKGYLYYHPKQDCIPSANINPNHAKYWWIYLREADDWLSDEDQFSILHKDDWLSTPVLAKKLLSKKECIHILNQELGKNARSLYIASYKNSKLISLGFIVHDTWPNL